jgi:hypothetical protein
MHWHEKCYWELQPLKSDDYSIYRLHTATTWKPSDDAYPIQVQRIPNRDGSSTFSATIPSDLLTRTHPVGTIPCISAPMSFDQYLKSIPKLDYYLLKHTSFPKCARTTMQDIQRLSSQGAILYKVSDGSMKNQSLSFGWVLGTNCGQKLAWGKGPGYGTDTSHRAEGWRKLAAAKFLFHLSKFTGTPYSPSTRIISFADNKGLITTLCRRTHYTTPYPNACLKPDWDLTEEIFQTYRSTDISQLTFSWVKGHQDSQKPLQQLAGAVEAQYNVTADQLSDEFMVANPRSRPLSPITHSARCTLIIKGATIHSHFTKAIRDASSLPELYGYLRAKFQLTKEIFQTINWTWFQTAACNYNHTDNHLMKLVYDQLPTRYTKSTKGGQSWLPVTCRFCDLEPETFEHLLKCDHSAGKDFRTALPRSIRSYCATRGAPHNFQVTIITAIEDWLRDKSPLQNIKNRAPVHSLAAIQARIGWSSFVKGFVAKQWQDYLEHELNSTHSQTADQPFDTDSFFPALIKCMWAQYTKFWTSHQQNLHAPTPTMNDDPVQLQELRLEIQQLHTLKGQVLSHHHNSYFPSDIDHFLQSSTISQLKTYVNNYKPAIYQRIKAAKQLSSKTRKLHQYTGFNRHQSSSTKQQTEPFFSVGCGQKTQKCVTPKRYLSYVGFYAES